MDDDLQGQSKKGGISLRRKLDGPVERAKVLADILHEIGFKPGFKL